MSESHSEETLQDSSEKVDILSDTSSDTSPDDSLELTHDEKKLLIILGVAAIGTAITFLLK